MRHTALGFAALIAAQAPMGGAASQPPPITPPERVTEFMQPGTHTLRFQVANTRDASVDKNYGSTCGRLNPFPGPMKGMVGWGQAEIGWLGENCMSFVMEVAVLFDTRMLDRVPNKQINSATLTYDEQEAPYCPLVVGYTYRCWQDGNGRYEVKRNGCVVVAVPAVNWAMGSPPGMMMPTVPLSANLAPRKIGQRTWDVTQPISWQLVPSSMPLGGQRGYGLLLNGGPHIRNLTAQDNTVCLSKLSNIRLHVTYTVPPEVRPIEPPH